VKGIEPSYSAWKGIAKPNDLNSSSEKYAAKMGRNSHSFRTRATATARPRHPRRWTMDELRSCRGGVPEAEALTCGNQTLRGSGGTRRLPCFPQGSVPSVPPNKRSRAPSAEKSVNTTAAPRGDRAAVTSASASAPAAGDGDQRACQHRKGG
jgi:hypothetical protein